LELKRIKEETLQNENFNEIKKFLIM